MSKKQNQLIQKAATEFNKRAVDAQKKFGTIQLPVKAEANKNTKCAIIFSILVGTTALAVAVNSNIAHMKTHKNDKRREWDLDRKIDNLKRDIAEKAETVTKKGKRTVNKVADKVNDTVEEATKNLNK